MAKQKSAAAFIREVIEPIEAAKPDTGTLYVLIPSGPKLDRKRPGFAREFEQTRFGSGGQTWELPGPTTPGAWQTPDDTGSPKYDILRLKTISGILWHTSRPGSLYRAEYSGPAAKLGLDDFILYLKTGWSDGQRREYEALARIDDCVQLGVKAKRVRLISRVANWTPYLLWTWLLDCAEHCYSLHTPPDAEAREVYSRGIAFGRAAAKYDCDIETSELERLVQASVADKTFRDLAWKRQNQTWAEVESFAEHDYVMKYLGKAIAAGVIGGYSSAFDGGMNCRTQNAYSYRSRYGDQYDYPTLITAKSVKENDMVKRIWYALMKEELNWQVAHLQEILGITK